MFSFVEPTVFSIVRMCCLELLCSESNRRNVSSG